MKQSEPFKISSKMELGVVCELMLELLSSMKTLPITISSYVQIPNGVSIQLHLVVKEVGDIRVKRWYHGNLHEESTSYPNFVKLIQTLPLLYEMGGLS